ncbi:MAG TPA: zinc-binding protein [Dehalococcoidia bacterium]|nr:zinc-binding protein [Dehalococcoidia bacterium]
MGYVDKTLECVECGASFTFTAAEQEFFDNKGFTNEPKRCPSCRQARKEQRRGSQGGYGRREMYPAVCASCGKDCEVPFEPREGRPVYCSDCYAQMKNQPPT